MPSSHPHPLSWAPPAPLLQGGSGTGPAVTSCGGGRICCIPQLRDFGEEAFPWDLKWISGLNAPDKALSWGSQHKLLALPHFPSGSCRSPQISLGSFGQQILRELSTKLLFLFFWTIIPQLPFQTQPVRGSKSVWVYKEMFTWRGPQLPSEITAVLWGEASCRSISLKVTWAVQV